MFIFNLCKIVEIKNAGYRTAVWITEVKKCPILWDVSDELYENRNKKNDACMSVATVLLENCVNITQAGQKAKSKYINYKNKYIKIIQNTWVLLTSYRYFKFYQTAMLLYYNSLLK